MTAIVPRHAARLIKPNLLLLIIGFHRAPARRRPRRSTGGNVPQSSASVACARSEAERAQGVDERGGASATAGSTNPGEMESEGGGKPTQREASVFLCRALARSSIRRAAGVSGDCRRWGEAGKQGCRRPQGGSAPKHQPIHINRAADGGTSNVPTGRDVRRYPIRPRSIAESDGKGAPQGNGWDAGRRGAVATFGVMRAKTDGPSQCVVGIVPAVCLACFAVVGC